MRRISLKRLLKEDFFQAYDWEKGENITDSILYYLEKYAEVLEEQKELNKAYKILENELSKTKNDLGKVSANCENVLNALQRRNDKSEGTFKFDVK